VEHELFELHFDKGNGAIFTIEHDGRRVRCFVSQDSSFLSKKASTGQGFPEIFERYKRLVVAAAHISVARHGASSDIWGNHVTDDDLTMAQTAQRRA